jgi:hypothetical protein
MEGKKKKKSMMFKKYIGIIVLVFGLISFFGIFWFIGVIKNPFKKNELRIENTNILVDDIKIISQLFTSSYYTEIVVDSIKKTPGIFSDYNHHLVVVARGTSYIGTDLSQLDTSNIVISKEDDKINCTLILPSAKIFNTVVNPSGFSIFIDSKGFTPDEVQSTKNKALLEIEKDVLNNGMLEKANERTKKLFTDLLIGMGFSKVTIIIK